MQPNVPPAPSPDPPLDRDVLRKSLACLSGADTRKMAHWFLLRAFPDELAKLVQALAFVSPHMAEHGLNMVAQKRSPRSWDRPAEEEFFVVQVPV